MKIVYTGQNDAVMVPYELDGRHKEFEARKGIPTECLDELAELLLIQDTWHKSDI